MSWLKQCAPSCIHLLKLNNSSLLCSCYSRLQFTYRLIAMSLHLEYWSSVVNKIVHVGKRKCVTCTLVLLFQLRCWGSTSAGTWGFFFTIIYITYSNLMILLGNRRTMRSLTQRNYIDLLMSAWFSTIYCYISSLFLTPAIKVSWFFYVIFSSSTELMLLTLSLQKI